MEFLFGLPEKTVFEKAYVDADIVQIQFPFYLGYGAAKTARAMNKPMIGAFHVQPYNIVSGLGKESKLLESVLFAFFKFFLFKRVPVILCPSQFAADLLKTNGINCHWHPSGPLREPGGCPGGRSAGGSARRDHEAGERLQQAELDCPLDRLAA